MVVTMYKIICLLIVACAFSLSAQSSVIRAHQYIKAGKYDDAIQVLTNNNPDTIQDVRTDMLLAVAYHWKRDFKKALFYYGKAAAIDKRYERNMMSCLEDLQDWEKIITLGKTLDLRQKKNYPALGPMASAYHAKHDKKNLELVKFYLKNIQFLSIDQIEYKNYILAKMYIWDTDFETALSCLEKIKNPETIKYLESEPVFLPLKNKARFKTLVNRVK